MAHFAQLDENNKVLQVIVIDNNELLVDGVESEEQGIQFCKSLFGENTNWKQTSYNANFRKHYAGINFQYNNEYDVFIPPKAFNSWILNTNTFIWEAPVPMPTDGKQYQWFEPNQEWIEIKLPTE